MQIIKWKRKKQRFKKLQCLLFVTYSACLALCLKLLSSSVALISMDLDNTNINHPVFKPNTTNNTVQIRVRWDEKELKRLMQTINIERVLAYNDTHNHSHLRSIEQAYGDVALSISHLRAIGQAYGDGYDIAIFLEDDAVLTPRFDDLWKEYISKAPPDWEMIHLYTKNHQAALHLKQIKDLFVHWNAWYWGSTAYVLNRKGMEKILQKHILNEEDRIAVSDELLASATISYQATRQLIDVRGSNFSMQPSETFSLNASFGNSLNVLIVTEVKNKIEHDRLIGEIEYVRNIHNGALDIAILYENYTIQGARHIDNLSEINGDYDCILMKHHGLSLQGFAWQTFLDFSKDFTIVGAMPVRQDHFSLRNWTNFNDEFDIYKLRTWTTGNRFDTIHSNGSYSELLPIQTDVLPTSFALIRADFFKWYVGQELPNALTWCGAAREWSSDEPCGLIPLGVKQVEALLSTTHHSADDSKWYLYSQRFRNLDLKEYFQRYDLLHKSGSLSFKNPFTHCKQTKSNTISIVLSAQLTPENLHTELFLHQTLPSLLNVRNVDEIVILDSSSTPPLEQWTSITSLIDKRVKIIRDERYIVTFLGYNKLFCLASGEIIIKMDVDNILGANFVELNNLKNLKKRTYLSGMWWEAKGKNDKHTNGFFVAYRQDIFDVWGYDNRLNEYGWDDSDLYIRLNLMADKSCCGAICQQMYLNLPQEDCANNLHLSHTYIEELVENSAFARNEVEHWVKYAQQIGVYCPNVRKKVIGVRHVKHVESKGSIGFNPMIHMQRIADFNPWHVYSNDISLFISRSPHTYTKELDASLETNLRNTAFQNVFVLYEISLSESNCTYFIDRTRTFAPIDKLKCIEWKESRPSYKQLYEYAYRLPTAGVIVFANSDIAFDQTIEKARSVKKNKLNVISVTGNVYQSPQHIFEVYKKHNPNPYIPAKDSPRPYNLCDPSWEWSGLSWDAYVFRLDSNVDFENQNYKEKLRYKGEEFFMNRDGAENAAALAFFYSGLNKRNHSNVHPRHLDHVVFDSKRWHPDNLCLQINAWHLHLMNKTHSLNVKDRVEHNRWLDAGASVLCTELENCLG